MEKNIERYNIKVLEHTYGRKIRERWRSAKRIEQWHAQLAPLLHRHDDL